MELAVLPLQPLPWQAAQWGQLQERMARDRLPHALLLHGLQGTGKGQLARLLAGALLCDVPVMGLPCGQCHACHLIQAGSHPDLFLASPAYGGTEAGEDAGGTEDAPAASRSKKVKVSRQIRIECIRDLIDFTHHASHQGGRRVAIIEPAEAMNISSANALLKTLEEPGAGMYLILVSHQVSRLMATVRSRCQSWLCQVPPRDTALSWLGQHLPMERAGFALDISGGAPLRALQAITDGDDTHFRQLQGILQDVRNGRINWLQAGEALASLDPARVLEWWWMYLHQQSCEQPRSSALVFADALLQARRRVQGTANPNARLLLESLLIEWAELPA